VSESSHAVFLSYASQDAEAARRIAETLRAAGIEVWFDQSELRGGDVWDQMIRQRIRDCALFIPVISANTASRGEGYFRLEWALADQRSQMMARNRSFIVPVCVDATPHAVGDVPESFERVQWTRLPRGDTPPAFPQRIATLLGGSPAEPARTPPTPAPIAPAARAPPRWRWLGAIAAVVVVLAAVITLRPWHMLTDRSAAPPVTQDNAPGPASANEKSVAVLPFTDMSERHDQEYFSDGLAEELIDTLTKVPELRVPARTSSFSFKGKAITVGEIARALGVSHVLEGSVRKSGEHLRITAQLVRADNGFHLWSQTYDRDVRDIFAVQDDIARAVAEELKLTLLGSGSASSGQTTNIDAHNLYLQARFLVQRDTVEDLDRAVLLFQQALKLDPNYAAAWAGLAYCHTRRVSNGLDTTGAGYKEATAAAERAIELDPRLPEGYITLAIAKMQYDLDWDATAVALAKVATLDPKNSLAEQSHGHLLVATGRMSDALLHFRRAVDGDPLNLLHRKYLGRALHYARRTTEAATVLRDAIAIDEHFPGLHYELGRTLLLQGDPDGAMKAFDAEANPAWRSFSLPIGYFAVHRLPQAQAALRELLAQSAGSEFQVAETYGFFGETDKAFEWLDRAVTLHDPGIIYLRRDEFLKSLEADPRYAALLKRIRVPPVSKDD
jgi:TolB-like protein/Tfp pilus assembly protein PilF